MSKFVAIQLPVDPPADKLGDPSSTYTVISFSHHPCLVAQTSFPLVRTH